jgi:hypothetical protein
MDGQLSRLCEFGLPHNQHPAFEIDIGIAQVDSLGDSQTSRGHQAKQGFIRRWAETSLWPEPTGRGQQCNDFLLVEDVRGDACLLWAEDRFLRNLGIRLELLQVAGEVANNR